MDYACAFLLFAEYGYTLLRTELEDAPFTNAKTNPIPPEPSTVEIVASQGAWIQVKEQQQNWLPPLGLRICVGQIIGGGRVTNPMDCRWYWRHLQI
ncbi:MAG TPA: hypothetical protein VLV32_00520 [Burkholderiales bacterium]|nr:hypothetical protein [Burkholderiales bacterium]